jgi:RNA recognition motif-containing protein
MARDETDGQINTLYVGNLPAISPPALPPNFLEESLRSMFQTCPGYKRMSFRQKINGPMCFVEFEDIHFAANCIQNLYGHTLVSRFLHMSRNGADNTVRSRERRYSTLILEELARAKGRESLHRSWRFWLQWNASYWITWSWIQSEFSTWIRIVRSPASRSRPWTRPRSIRPSRS